MLDISPAFMIDKTKIQKVLAKRLGINLSGRRKTVGWTQGELAEQVGVDTETISRFERGATMPSLVTIQMLAVALDTTMANLIGESSSMPNDQAQIASIWLSGLKAEDREFAMGMLNQWCIRLKKR